MLDGVKRRVRSTGPTYARSVFLGLTQAYFTISDRPNRLADRQNSESALFLEVPHKARIGESQKFQTAWSDRTFLEHSTNFLEYIRYRRRGLSL